MDISCRPWGQFCSANTVEVPVNLQGVVERAIGTETHKTIQTALNCLPFQLNPLMVVESLSIFTEVNFFVPSPHIVCLSPLPHFCWVSWLEILSQGQFLWLIVDSVFLRHLFPQFLSVTLVSSQASKHDAFPTSRPSRSTPLALPPPLPGPALTAMLHWPWALPGWAHHILLSFCFFLASLPFSFFPSPFLLGGLICPIWSSDVSWVHYILSHLLAPSRWWQWTRISGGRFSLCPEASPWLDLPTVAWRSMCAPNASFLP